MQYAKRIVRLFSIEIYEGIGTQVKDITGEGDEESAPKTA
jgi:hypothetical protein